LAGTLAKNLRRQSILLPPIDVIERICAEAITHASRRIYASLTGALTPEHQRQLDALLNLRAASKVSTLVWLRQPPGAPNAKHLLEHIERLKVMEALTLPPSTCASLSPRVAMPHWSPLFSKLGRRSSMR
jgi:hypothetical protein